MLFQTFYFIRATTLWMNSIQILSMYCSRPSDVVIPAKELIHNCPRSCRKFPRRYDIRLLVDVESDSNIILSGIWKTPSAAHSSGLRWRCDMNNKITAGLVSMLVLLFLILQSAADTPGLVFYRNIIIGMHYQFEQIARSPEDDKAEGSRQRALTNQLTSASSPETSALCRVRLNNHSRMLILTLKWREIFLSLSSSV